VYAVNGVVVELDDPEVRHAGDALRTHRPQLVVRQVPENRLVLEIIIFSVFAASVCSFSMPFSAPLISLFQRDARIEPRTVRMRFVIRSLIPGIRYLQA
jgi:hypothetical protein